MRTLLGGLALCPCGNVVSGMPNHRGQRVYRCQPPLMTITLLSPGKGARRAFDPATVQVTWRQPG